MRPHILQNDVFGSLRTVDEDGKIMFVASDVAKMLGYTNPSKAISDHCKGVTKRYTLTKGGKQAMNFIPEGDLYRLITHSKLPSAEKFESWVFDEVLPAIRKTGEYKTQTATQQDESKQDRAKSMLLNARTRQAKLWKELAEGATGTYAEVCKTYAVNTLAGKDVLELSALAEKTYSATEVGNILGISAHMVGKIANDIGIKTDEYGKWFHDKSKYSSKEVETFRYNNAGIKVIRAFAKIN